jgi:hypothetical protein
MTAIGVTGYLFHLEEYMLSFISMIVFGKLIILSWNILIEKISNRRLSKYGKNKTSINL